MQAQTLRFWRTYICSDTVDIGRMRFGFETLFAIAADIWHEYTDKDFSIIYSLCVCRGSTHSDWSRASTRWNEPTRFIIRTIVADPTLFLLLRLIHRLRKVSKVCLRSPKGYAKIGVKVVMNVDEGRTSVSQRASHPAFHSIRWKLHVRYPFLVNDQHCRLYNKAALLIPLNPKSWQYLQNSKPLGLTQKNLLITSHWCY